MVKAGAETDSRDAPPTFGQRRRDGLVLGALLLAGSACGGSCGHDRGAKAMMVTPLGGTWTAMASAAAPSSDGGRAAVWSGTELFVWGGSGLCPPLGLCASGASYAPAQDRWTPIADAGLLGMRDQHAATWTGQALFVWGGRGCGGPTTACGDGGLYDPATGQWSTVAAAGAPSARGWVAAAWTGSEVAVWGGEDPATAQVLGDGALYDPAAGTWRAMTPTGAPSPRRYHPLLWTGSELIVWGGDGDARTDVGLSDGGAYDPAKGSWRKLSPNGAPAGRWAHTAVWTGSEVLVFGGLGCSTDGTGAPVACGDGARYDPAADRWTAMAMTGAPSARVGHTAVWTGHEMIVWGGSSTRCADGSSGACADGAAYDPAADHWRPLIVPTSVGPRSGHIAAWTGSAMLAWGGTGAGASEASLLDGVVFTPSPP